MIGTVMRIGWLELRRSPVELALCFALPIAFFTIFVMIVGGGSGKQSTPKVSAALVDLDGSDASKRFVEAVKKEDSLRILKDAPKDRLEAANVVRSGKAAAAIVIPEKFGEHFGDFSSNAAAVEVYADSSDPVAANLTAGLLQKAAMSSVDLLAERGFEMFEKFGGAMTPLQKAAIEKVKPMLKNLNKKEDAPPKEDVAKSSGSAAMAGLVNVKVQDVLGETKKNPVAAFYAASVVVMFLLFSASASGGSLLEEQEAGTLDRLLSSQLTMSELLLGKWLYFTIIGCLQIIAMFVWAWLVFGVELPTHIPGFLFMTFPTAAAASAFGLVLASLCRSREQLAGVSTIVILSMSAIGGSMIPRFIMPESMKTFGLVTFNAWALDGYQAIFWRDASWLSVWPQVLAISAFCGVFYLTARFFARRWEAA
jgi:ABC-2 type transport system permease protein